LAWKRREFIRQDGLQPKIAKLPKVSERPPVHLPFCKDKKEGVEKAITICRMPGNILEPTQQQQQ
jgi:hypothetical protein